MAAPNAANITLSKSAAWNGRVYSHDANVPAQVVAPTLSSPTMTSTGASIAFTGGTFVSNIPQWSTDNSTWTSIADDTSSPVTFTGLSSSSALRYFRTLANGTTASNVVSGYLSVTAPTITAARLNDTTVRFTFSGGLNAATWTGYYRTPSGSGSYTSASLTVGQSYYDVTVASLGNADLYVTAANTGGSATSATCTGTAANNVYQFPLPSGRAMPSANLTMRMLHPLPDASTASFERHRLQAAGQPLRIPGGVLGGIPPFQYSVSSDMPGLTIGADMPKDWQTNGLQNYGVLMCDAPTAGTYTTTVTVTDQASTQVTTTFTTVVADKNDTTKFRWFDAVNGSNANSGTFDSPYKDDLKLAYGSTSGATTFQGHVIFKDTSTYTVASQTDLTNGVRLNSGRQPIVYYTNPVSGSVGRRAKFDFSSARFVGLTSFSCLVQGLYVGEIDHSGAAPISNMQNYIINDGQDRITFFNIDNTSIGVGTVGNDNASFCFFSNGASSSDSTYNHNVFFRGVKETGRPFAGNSYGITSAFGLNYALFEDCHCVNSNSSEDLYLKDSCKDVTLRYCIGDNGLATGAQNQNGGTTANIEYVHCVAKSAIAGIAVNLGAGGLGCTEGNTYVSRCTLYGKLDVNSNSTATGTYYCYSTVIYTSNSPAANFGGKTSSNTNTELQGNTAWIDTSTMQLTGSYRTTYLGTRGAEISDV